MPLFHSRFDTWTFLRQSRNQQYYVYVLRDPLVQREGQPEPFYVGCSGKPARVFQHESERLELTRNPEKVVRIQTIKEQGRELCYEIIRHFAGRHDALRMEEEVIAQIGRKPRGPLLNRTAGGDGTQELSEEARARRQETLAGDSDPIQRAMKQVFAQLKIPTGPKYSFPLKNYQSWGKERRLAEGGRRYGTTVRSLGALATAAHFAGIKLARGVSIPRCFPVVSEDGLQSGIGIIENGCGHAILQAKLAEYRVEDVSAATKSTAEDEFFKLTERGYSEAKGFGLRALEELNIMTSADFGGEWRAGLGAKRG